MVSKKNLLLLCLFAMVVLISSEVTARDLAKASSISATAGVVNEQEDNVKYNKKTCTENNNNGHPNCFFGGMPGMPGMPGGGMMPGMPGGGSMMPGMPGGPGVKAGVVNEQEDASDVKYNKSTCTGDNDDGHPNCFFGGMPGMPGGGGMMPGMPGMPGGGMMPGMPGGGGGMMPGLPGGPGVKGNHGGHR